ACLFLRNFHKHQKLRSPAPPGVPLPPWVTWTPSQQARRSGTYTVGSPNEPPEGPEKEIDEPPGDHSSTVQAPYGDDTVTNQEPRTIEPQNQEPASKLANTQAGARAKDPPPKEPADKRWVQGYRSLF